MRSSPATICSHFEFERHNPDGRWYQVYDMRIDDGTFIGVRVDITELKRREKALRDSMRQIDLFRHVLDELPVAAFIKARRPARRIRQQGLEFDYRHFQGGGRRPYRSRAVRRRRSPRLHRCRCRSQRHRQGRREGGAGRPSRRHRQAADDPQEPAGGDRRVGAHGRIEHRHHRHEGARGSAQPEPARQRGVSQPDRQRARGDLRQAPGPQAVLRQQGLVRPDRPQQGRGDRQDRRRDLRAGRRSLHGRRPRGAAAPGARRSSPRPSPRPTARSATRSPARAR